MFPFSPNCVRPRPTCRGFSLIEMLAVLAVVAILLGVTMSLFGNTGSTALRNAAETVTATIEQGRTSAITRHAEVALVVLEPGVAGFGDELYRIGLIELEDDEDTAGDIIEGRLLNRWQALPGGIALFGGTVDSLKNVMDGPKAKVRWRDGRSSAQAHAIVFSPRGGLVSPRGSESVVLTIGNGTYRDSRAVRLPESGTRNIRIGRVVARPWNLDV